SILFQFDPVWRKYPVRLSCPHNPLVMFFLKQKTAYEIQVDWSSDVCSSDLSSARRSIISIMSASPSASSMPAAARSEERRVGKSVDLGGRRIIKTNTKV